ncbi:MAG: HNH endonuclease signature motif containing protein [Bacteroidota bacterium]
MSRKRIPQEDKTQVLQRADGRCEYCKSLRKYSPQPFTIDHILPVALRGSDELDNLALACGGCNGHKSNKTSALDPITGRETALFHPRTESWTDHFEWDAEFVQMIGLTPIGRATVRALKLNRPSLINLRKITKLTGEHPPEG